ncbi:MAG: hypothetical protein QOH90_538 [Actinomycetota bacterium]|jgi:hypothetical protein|nr:hypothetical protein [Actinomycetota bacterium]
MNGHFTREIGRMRSAEMINRGIRRQELAAASPHVEYRSPKITEPAFVQTIRILLKGRRPGLV